MEERQATVHSRHPVRQRVFVIVSFYIRGHPGQPDAAGVVLISFRKKIILNIKVERPFLALVRRRQNRTREPQEKQKRNKMIDVRDGLTLR
jgi:hypothetical protein